MELDGIVGIIEARSFKKSERRNPICVKNPMRLEPRWTNEARTKKGMAALAAAIPLESNHREAVALDQGAWGFSEKLVMVVPSSSCTQ